jgi:hypothetical protein
MRIAQAVIEHGLLDSIGTRMADARYQIDARLGQGSTKWLLAGLGLLLFYWLVRRR